MDRSIKTVRQLEQVFEPDCMTFKELKEKRTSNHKVSAKKNIKKILKSCFFGGLPIFG
jgi:hypothetical protein